MDLVDFHNWYLATRENSCRETVIKLHEKIHPASFDNAWSRINEDLFGYVQMDQHGKLTATPPKFVNANTLINSMKP